MQTNLYTQKIKEQNIENKAFFATISSLYDFPYLFLKIPGESKDEFLEIIYATLAISFKVTFFKSFFDLEFEIAFVLQFFVWAIILYFELSQVNIISIFQVNTNNFVFRGISDLILIQIIHRLKNLLFVDKLWDLKDLM